MVKKQFLEKITEYHERSERCIASRCHNATNTKLSNYDVNKNIYTRYINKFIDHSLPGFVWQRDETPQGEGRGARFFSQASHFLVA